MGSKSRSETRKGDLRYVLAVRPGSFTAWSTAFINACGHVANGEFSLAKELLNSVDGRAISLWFDYTAQNAGRDRAVVIGLLGRSGGGKKSTQPRDSQRMPDDATQSRVLERDRYRCRYCRQAVLPAGTLQTVSSKTGVNLNKAKTNLETHGLYWLHCASIDHVVPHAQSGRSVETNLVVSCKACQFGKSWYTLNQLGLNLRLPAPDLSTPFGKWSKTVVALASHK
jgi:5-methylcytosine-specific restriction endonuclease McrA